MTKEELLSAIQEKGYSEPDFISDLNDDDTGTIEQLLHMMDAEKVEEAWDEIERLHDEFIYFGIYDDEYVVVEAI